MEPGAGAVLTGAPIVGTEGTVGTTPMGGGVEPGAGTGLVGVPSAGGVELTG